MGQSERRFTVLIDADNVPPEYIKCILDETSDVGIAIYEHIYGDWTDNERRSWKDVLLDRSINPIQQYSYTAGRNATDSTTIIDAMDILYSGSVDGFHLVSNDSGFTKLTQRLKRAGMFVMGIGEQKTPKPFCAACNTFRLLETVSSNDMLGALAIENQRTITNIDEIRKAVTKLLIENNSQDQPIILARVGNFLTKRFPDFSARNYGYSRLSAFSENLNNSDLRMAKLHGGYFIQEENANISKTEIEKEIIHVIKGYNDRVNNLGIIRNELKKAYPSFDVKQYGFSRISSFIQSFETFHTKDDMIQLK